MNVAALIERRARIAPDAPALIAADGTASSWGQMRQRVGAAAQRLREARIGALDRVALLAANSPAYAEVILAVASLGAVVVPLNWRLTAGEIAEQLADSGLALLLFDAAHAELAAAATSLAKCRTERIEEIGHGDTRSSLAPDTVDADHPLGIFYTGGTTGRTKGVVLTHGNLAANARNVATQVKYRADDVHLHVMPMFHLADLGAFFCQLLQGGAHVFLPHFRPELFLDCIKLRRITTCVLAPTAIQALFAADAIARRDLSSWRLLWYGGSPITDDTLRRALTSFRGDLVQGYGQTEATHTISLMSADDHRSALTRSELLSSCGRPIPGVEVKLIDDEGQVRAGAVGEIAVRGATVMKEYWNRPAETAAALRGGWLHTGDLAQSDESGRLTIVDRKKDVIVSGAENVFSAEVENALAAHPAVAECAAFAVPDDRLGERVHAAIVLRPGAAADGVALAAHCRERIAAYKTPRSFEFHAALPKTAFGKVQKALLREPHWRGRARRVG